jgi:hypothetical protein
VSLNVQKTVKRYVHAEAIIEFALQLRTVLIHLLEMELALLLLSANTMDSLPVFVVKPTT